MNHFYTFAAVILSMACCVLKKPEWALLSLSSTKKKDATAEGIAKIRHCESILENPAERLYADPYAHLMYPGSGFLEMLGGNKSRKLYDFFLEGMFDHLTLRTKWIDDAILERTATATTTTTTTTADQLVILGAGYDTRGFRLDLPENFAVWEVDQPCVQSKKRKILESIAITDPNVAERLGKSGASFAPHVEFLAIDFNKDSIGERLTSSSSSSSSSGDTATASAPPPPRFDPTKTTIVTLEGVSQYIPKSATASTLKQVRAVVPEGSTLLISYVPTRAVEDPGSACPKRPLSVKLLLKAVGWIGEPWISHWTGPDDFASFLSGSGYRVVEDLGFAELNRKYLLPRGRSYREEDLCNLERYAVARAV